MRIDAHLHLWPSPEGYRWLTEALAPIRRGFAPDEARAAINGAGFDDAVLVQAADSDTDTDWLLTIAEAHDWVAGVVGWVPLDDPARAEARLDALVGRPLVGVRMLLNDQPDRVLLDRPAARETLALLAARGLPFDVHDAWPHHLVPAAHAVAEIDGLTMVLDHLGKVPGDARALGEWRAALDVFAAVPTTVAKLSGLHRLGAPLPQNAFERAWNAALEAFGPARLMLGSDWPLPLLGDGLEPIAAQMQEALATLSPDERAHLEAGTARRIYRLEE
mgnify:CR=1 FL=1